MWRVGADRLSHLEGLRRHRGMNDTSDLRSDVHIVGGGLAGLAAAAFVARAGHSVTVHESRGRLGGRATTDEHHGFRFNQGPHALYRHGPGEQVLERLGIRPAASPPPIAGSQAVLDGELHLLPVGATSMMRSRLLGTRDKAQLGILLARLPKLDPAPWAGRTVDELVDELLDRPRARAVAHTLLRVATYSDLPAHLSAEVALTQLQLAVAHGVVYLHGGWEPLVAAVAERAGARIVTGERLTELPDAPAVIVAAGGPDAAAALTGHPYDPGIAAGASVLDLGLSAAPPHDFAVGVDEALYLSNHGRDVGVPDGFHSVSLAAYLAHGEASVSRERLMAFARVAGIADDSVVEERYLHHMTVVSAVATAERGGLAGRPPVQVPDRPGVFVAGDWVGPRGHLVDAVLASAEDAARAAVAHLERRPVLR